MCNPYLCLSCQWFDRLLHGIPCGIDLTRTQLLLFQDLKKLEWLVTNYTATLCQFWKEKKQSKKYSNSFFHSSSFKQLCGHFPHLNGLSHMIYQPDYFFLPSLSPILSPLSLEFLLCPSSAGAMLAVAAPWTITSLIDWESREREARAPPRAAKKQTSTNTKNKVWNAANHYSFFQANTQWTQTELHRRELHFQHTFLEDVTHPQSWQLRAIKIRLHTQNE